jgi:hypothetical protein
MLRDRSAFCQQAYAELLFLYHAVHQDAWSRTRIRGHLASGKNIPILRGFAYAARSLYDEAPCERLATEILCRLAPHPDKSVQQAVAAVFHIQRDAFDLRPSMQRIIRAVSQSPAVLLQTLPHLPEVLEPFAAREPALVSRVCRIVLRTAGREVGNIASGTARAAQPLTNIALTLHRQKHYREVGLKLFEALIMHNIKEARIALELLDRKPASNF